MRTTIAVTLVASLMVAAPAHAASQSVSIGDFFYRADRARIDPGDSVTWTNRGEVLHTVTSRRGAPEGFNSGERGLRPDLHPRVPQGGHLRATCARCTRG